MFTDNRPDGINYDATYIVNMDSGRLCVTYLADSGYSVGTYISNISLYSVLFGTLGGMLFFMIIVIIVSVIISVRFARYFSKPIATISNAMTGFNMESLDEKITVDTNTELDDIGASYNTMLGHVSGLMNTVKEKENEIRDLEMASLMDQIHPHFLYNTLENIYMLAKECQLTYRNIIINFSGHIDYHLIELPLMLYQVLG